MQTGERYPHDPPLYAEGTICESQISPLSCGVRRLFICVIKLKDIILEIKKGTKLPVFLISKQEELEALNTIKAIIVPLNVEKWKEYGSRTTADEVRRKIRKVKI